MKEEVINLKPLTILTLPAGWKMVSRLVVFVICFAIVWLASAPTFAGGLLFKRLRPRVAATQKTVTIQKQATATVSSSGGCRMIDGKLVCPRR